MWQYQESDQRGQEPPRMPAGDSPGDSPSKWWHVADGQIEEMIRRLNDDTHKFRSLQGSNRRPSALRDPSASMGTSRQPNNVHFDDYSRSHALSSGYYEDSLDQVLRESYDPPRREKGSWKVSDEALKNFIANAKKTLNEDEEAGAYMPDGRAVFGNAGGSLTTSQQASSSFTRNQNSTFRKAASQPLLGQRNPSQAPKKSASQPLQVRSRNSRNELSARPAWDNKMRAYPNVFSRVGVGLDGKGSKLISESAKYEETPIFLPDARDFNLEKVRVRVCGHPQYLK